MSARSLLVGMTLLAVAGVAGAASPDEAIISLDRYTTEKGKALDRYLNIWVQVEQEITPEFRALTTSARRASTMFSRHGVDLLRQISADASVFADPSLHGYSVILTWIKPNGQVGKEEEKAETLGVFTDKATVRAFLTNQNTAKEFIERATIVAFDGRDRLGRLPLEIWEDNFAATFKPKGYEPEDKSVRC